MLSISGRLLCVRVGSFTLTGRCSKAARTGGSDNRNGNTQLSTNHTQIKKHCTRLRRTNATRPDEDDGETKTLASTQANQRRRRLLDLVLLAAGELAALVGICTVERRERTKRLAEERERRHPETPENRTQVQGCRFRTVWNPNPTVAQIGHSPARGGAAVARIPTHQQHNAANARVIIVIVIVRDGYI